MSEINRVYYNKLVRDNIPAKIEAKRQQCDIRKITDVQELQQELFKKVQEEAASLSKARTKEEFLEEYSDLMVVLETLIRQLEISKDELIKFRKDNLITKGGYKHGHFLHWSADVDYRSNESVQGIPL
ncbi:nucleoside triphosphate pyrophosphohydrolase [Candidatus Nomurabacteria bacterium]|nr:nucleoside triphosphate pyrophosphohydrolase [Candidatus Kaiserbacteria bacterium]MCA9359814.1 nucleoside triphosphate pyrophosphohydrolase [Candidatus Kaiserbacteria bacterium]MCB9810250.1 nucleoside triphosphate pyrophosphohydrolase [Candidatus Nomurabacteria bacterium]